VEKGLLLDDGPSTKEDLRASTYALTTGASRSSTLASLMLFTKSGHFFSSSSIYPRRSLILGARFSVFSFIWSGKFFGRLNCISTQGGADYGISNTRCRESGFVCFVISSVELLAGCTNKRMSSREAVVE